MHRGKEAIWFHILERYISRENNFWGVFKDITSTTWNKHSPLILQVLHHSVLPREEASLQQDNSLFSPGWLRFPGTNLKKLVPQELLFSFPWFVFQKLSFIFSFPETSHMFLSCLHSALASSTPLQGSTLLELSWDMVPPSKRLVAWILVNSERDVRTCGYMKIFAFVFLSVGIPRSLALFQPLDLSFYEDNGDHRAILLASLRTLRDSQPHAFPLKTTCRGT